MIESSTNIRVPLYKPKKSNKFVKHVFPYKYIIIFIILATSMIIWTKVKVINAENVNLSQQEQIIFDNENSLDNINRSHLIQSTNIIAWAVQRHLLYDNFEEINLLFMSIVSDKNVSKIQLISPIKWKVLVSTDKSEEGQNFNNRNIIRANNVEILKTNNNQTEIVVAPIMGLNQKEGILVVYYNL